MIFFSLSQGRETFTYGRPAKRSAGHTARSRCRPTLSLRGCLLPQFAASPLPLLRHYACASYSSFTARSMPNLALHRGRLAPLTSVPLFNFCIPTCSLRPWRPTPLPWKPWLCGFDRRRPPCHGDAMAVLQAPAAIMEPCLLRTPEAPMHHRRWFLLQPTV